MTLYSFQREINRLQELTRYLAFTPNRFHHHRSHYNERGRDEVLLRVCVNNMQLHVQQEKTCSHPHPIERLNFKYLANQGTNKSSRRPNYRVNWKMDALVVLEKHPAAVCECTTYRPLSTSTSITHRSQHTPD